MVIDPNIIASTSLKFKRKLRRLRETGPRTISMSSLHAANKGSVNYSAWRRLRAATNESQKTRNKNQETKRFSTFAVSRLRHSNTKKKNIA